MNEQVQAQLKKIFNGRFSTSESTRSNYARGEDTYDTDLSKSVFFQETNTKKRLLNRKDNRQHLLKIHLQELKQHKQKNQK